MGRDGGQGFALSLVDEHLPAQIGDVLLAGQRFNRCVADQAGLAVKVSLYITLGNSCYLGQCDGVKHMMLIALVNFVFRVVGLEHFFF